MNRNLQGLYRKKLVLLKYINYRHNLIIHNKIRYIHRSNLTVLLEFDAKAKLFLPDLLAAYLPRHMVFLRKIGAWEYMDLNRKGFDRLDRGDLLGGLQVQILDKEAPLTDIRYDRLRHNDLIQGARDPEFYRNRHMHAVIPATFQLGTERLLRSLCPLIDVPLFWILIIEERPKTFRYLLFVSANIHLPREAIIGQKTGHIGGGAIESAMLGPYTDGQETPELDRVHRARLLEIQNDLMKVMAADALLDLPGHFLNRLEGRRAFQIKDRNPANFAC